VVQVTDTSHALTTVRALTSYGQISPGDPVMRYVPPATTSGEVRQVDTGNLKGMIVEIQADKPMTMVSHHNVVYLDRGNRDGLQIGDLLDIQRRSGGLPVRKIGQIKVIATEEHTATAQVVKATARVFKGDRFTSTGQSTPIAQPGELTPVPALTTDRSPIPSDLVANTLKQSEVSGESRINLGNLEDSLRYESGEAAIKPDGYAVLDQLIDHLRTSGDTRLIRVEGHTDNVEIGPSLKARYPSNLELSKARAGNVARYLVEKGSVDSARLQSVGYGDRKPVATNTNEEGRSKNRRVEVVLYDPAVEPPASTSNPDNQLQPGEQSPSEVKTQGTISTIPSENNNSSPASAPENSSMPTEKPLTADSEGNPLETSNNPDAPAARPSGDQQDTQKTTGDPLGMDNGFPADEGLPSDGQQAAPKPADDPLGMDNGLPAGEGLPSGGQQETASNMLSTEPSSSEYNPPLQETDMQSGDEPLSLSTDSVGF
ncbi:MAG: OmpA family protein, partial [Nitrospira sp.]|nr:OmpA family protein [Nitrospira sp.]